MATRVALLSRDQIARLLERAREVVEYRKSGLSLNHIQGCPLDCAYCIRHTYGLWDQRVPRALMRDPEAVEELAHHHYFQPHVTPVQVFNRATDPFLPVVRPHTFAVLEDLDARGLRNHVLVITRHQMKPEDIDRLNALSPSATVGPGLFRPRGERRPTLGLTANWPPSCRTCTHAGKSTSAITSSQPTTECWKAQRASH
ncbi:MAG: hypothetical protein ACRDS9_27480 [Pseudonocardiaceae bacterium]